MKNDIAPDNRSSEEWYYECPQKAGRLDSFVLKTSNNKWKLCFSARSIYE